MTRPTQRVVAITGGNGFIGRRLVQMHVAKGDRIRVLSRIGRGPSGWDSNVQNFVGDLVRDADQLREFVDGADVLYHCAGEFTNQRLMRELHVSGTQRLMDAAARRIGHWVHLSSVGIYGPRSSGVVDETTDFAPVGEYEITKAQSESLLSRQAADRGFTYSILRPSIVFGADMTNNSLRQLVRVIDRGMFFFIGAPGANAPYVPVEEVARALWVCGIRPEARNQAYNFSENIRIEEFVGAIARALGHPLPRLRIARSVARAAATIGKLFPGFALTHSRIEALTSRAIYDSSKIRNELGFTLEMSIEQRLRAFVEQTQAISR